MDIEDKMSIIQTMVIQLTSRFSNEVEAIAVDFKEKCNRHVDVKVAEINSTMDSVREETKRNINDLEMSVSDVLTSGQNLQKKLADRNLSMETLSNNHERFAKKMKLESIQFGSVFRDMGNALEAFRSEEVRGRKVARRSERIVTSKLDEERKRNLEFKILNRVQDGLKVQSIHDKGRGVVATTTFQRGDFVVEYIGEMIDLKEAKQREFEYGKHPGIGCYMYYITFKNNKKCIDATAESGRFGRLINHSKTSGNCQPKIVDISNEPHLVFCATKTIYAGDEILYDYGDRSKESITSYPWLKK